MSDKPAEDTIADVLFDPKTRKPYSRGRFLGKVNGVISISISVKLCHVLRRG